MFKMKNPDDENIEEIEIEIEIEIDDSVDIGSKKHPDFYECCDDYSVFDL
jgi:hypothetical protein